MTDDTENMGSVTPNLGGLNALQELVDHLIRVDVAGSDESGTAPLNAQYRASLQELVTDEMKRDDAAPDLQKLITAALEKWAAVE